MLLGGFKGCRVWKGFVEGIGIVLIEMLRGLLLGLDIIELSYIVLNMYRDVFKVRVGFR